MHCNSIKPNNLSFNSSPNKCRRSKCFFFLFFCFTNLTLQGLYVIYGWGGGVCLQRGDFQRSGNGGSFSNAVEWGKGGKLLE